MSSIPNSPIWVEFFAMYRDLPVLWKVKSDTYKDRNKKKIAWEKLLELYKQIEPSANIDSLKLRLSNIRTVYRREMRRVELSERSAVEEGDVYVPSLWYYNHLDFLRDQEKETMAVIYFETTQDDEDGIKLVEESTDETPAKSLIKKRKVLEQCVTPAERNSQQKETCTPTNSNKDEATIFAESWAISYRKLNSTQKLFAKKAIDDILILGQLDLLSLHTVSYSTPVVSQLSCS